MREDDGIGRRVATERKLRGLTQRQLAERAHLSHSLVAKVESGHAPASGAFVLAVARALRVERGRLTGQPYYSGDRRLDAVHDAVQDLRREIVAFRLPPENDRPVPALDALGTAVAEVSQLGHWTDWLGVGARLPEVLGDLRAVSHSYAGTDRERVMTLLTVTYDTARQLCYEIGHKDLASMLVDRYEWAAGQSGDPLTVAVGDVMRARELMDFGEWRSCEQTLSDSRDRLEPDLPSGGEPVLSVFGYLHLELAMAAARRGNADTTWDHLGEAERVAERVAPDRNDYRLVFNRSNVAIWGVALAVELMDGRRAVERVRTVRLDPSIPPERVGHHHIDLARGQFLYGDRPAALGSLLTARKIAPQQTRYHPMARETVHALARAERRSSDTLRGLASWMGIQD